MDDKEKEKELCGQVFAQVLGAEPDELHFPELLMRAKQLLYTLPEGWEVVTGQSDLEGIPMFFNRIQKFSQWNHPLEEVHMDTMNRLRDDLLKQDSELVGIQEDSATFSSFDSAKVISESPVVQNLNFVSEIEIIFAQLLGVDTAEPNAFQLIFLAKELLYSLPQGWEVVSGQSDLGIIPYFFDTVNQQSFWTHPFEDECIQIIDNKRLELNGGMKQQLTIEEGDEYEQDQETPQKGVRQSNLTSGDVSDIQLSNSQGTEQDANMIELTELDILFAHVLGVDVDNEPHAMELCYLAKALLYELPDTWELSVSVSEEAGGAAIPVFYDNETQSSFWTHPYEAAHKQRIVEAREILKAHLQEVNTGENSSTEIQPDSTPLNQPEANEIGITADVADIPLSEAIVASNKSGELVPVSVVIDSTPSSLPVTVDISAPLIDDTTKDASNEVLISTIAVETEHLKTVDEPLVETVSIAPPEVSDELTAITVSEGEVDESHSDVAEQQLNTLKPQQVVEAEERNVEQTQQLEQKREVLDNETESIQQTVNKEEQLVKQQREEKERQEEEERMRLVEETAAAEQLAIERAIEEERILREKEIQQEQQRMAEAVVDVVVGETSDSVLADSISFVIDEKYIEEESTLVRHSDECIERVLMIIANETVDASISTCVDRVIVEDHENELSKARKKELLDQRMLPVNDSVHAVVGLSEPVAPVIHDDIDNSLDNETEIAVGIISDLNQESVAHIDTASCKEIPLVIVTTIATTADNVATDAPSLEQLSFNILSPETQKLPPHFSGNNSVHSGSIHSAKSAYSPSIDALMNQRIIKVKTDYLKMLRNNKIVDSKLGIVSTSPNKQEHSASESDDSPFKVNKKKKELSLTYTQPLVPDFTSPDKKGQFKRLAPMEPICSVDKNDKGRSKGAIKWHLLGSYDIHKEAVNSRQVIVHIVTVDSFGTILIDPRDNFVDSYLEAELLAEETERERVKASTLRSISNNQSTNSLLSTSGLSDRGVTASPAMNVHTLSMKPELIIGRMKSNSEKSVKIRIRRDVGRMQWVIETDDMAVKKIVKRHRKKGKVENNMVENSGMAPIKRITKHVTPIPTAESLTESKSFGLIAKISKVELSQSLPFRDRGDEGDSPFQSTVGKGKKVKPMSRALQRGSVNRNNNDGDEGDFDLGGEQQQFSKMNGGVMRQSSEGQLKLPSIVVNRNISST